MSEQLRFRTPTSEDARDLAAIGRETFVETFGDLYSPADLQSFLDQVHSPNVVAAEIANPDLMYQVVEDRNELIAYIKIGPVHVPVKHPLPGAMEIWQLYVRAAYIGSGIGSRLMEWANQQFTANSASEVYVSVFSENERAIRFYQRNGFEKIGEYGFLVGQHVDREWMMRRPM